MKGISMVKDMFKRLQLFAEMGAAEQGVDGAGDSAAEDQESTQSDQEEAQESNQEPKKKYTDEDVDKIIAKKIAAERKRMSKLFNEEQTESELEKRERAVQKRELMADAKDALAEEGLPTALSSMLDYTDRESYKNSLEEVSSIFRSAVMNEVKRTLAGKPPRVGCGFRKSEDDIIANAFAPNRTR